jgi:hypothetical protein
MLKDISHWSLLKSIRKSDAHLTKLHMTTSMATSGASNDRSKTKNQTKWRVKIISATLIVSRMIFERFPCDIVMPLILL